MTNPVLSLIQNARVVFRKPTDNKVTLISGGGSGHEPSHCGYVGKGMLDAAVAGSIFASPSSKQIMEGLRAIRTDSGTLVILMNYTGDVLNFGLATERAKNEGMDIDVVIVGDDVAVGREKGSLVGRRGLAGTLFVLKIAGALADQGYDLAKIAETAQSIVPNLVTMGASLEHCDVPGREGIENKLKDKEIEIGMGIHNEPGVQRVSPIPTSSELASKMLKFLLDPQDKDRAYTSFRPTDEVALMINNLGGLSNLEISAFTAVTCAQLKENYGISPKRVYLGAFMTSLNGPGVSITLVNLSNIKSPKGILSLLDYPVEAPGWNGNVKSWANVEDADIIVKSLESDQIFSGNVVKSNEETFKRILENIQKELIKIEPEVTKFDTIAGDGDCGETLVTGSNGIIDAMKKNKIDLSNLSLALNQISEIIEDKMGGTSGALYAIFISALAKGIQNSGCTEASVECFSRAAEFALASLSKYTPARIGDRTLMDALEPFVMTLKSSGNIDKAAEAAIQGAASTEKMKARLGRASYVGDESEGGLPPDPGMHIYF